MFLRISRIYIIVANSKLVDSIRTAQLVSDIAYTTGRIHGLPPATKVFTCVTAEFVYYIIQLLVEHCSSPSV